MSQDLTHTLTYLQSELHRMETIAGTLATVERDHFKRLSNFDHNELMEIAVEEQNASRQLGTVKQICLALTQRVDEMKQELEKGDLKERAKRVEVH